MLWKGSLQHRLEFPDDLTRLHGKLRFLRPSSRIVPLPHIARFHGSFDEAAVRGANEPETVRKRGNVCRKTWVRMAKLDTYDSGGRSHDELKCVVERCLQLAEE